jgi:murein L,D-transpeptidase YcbB/YkuD
MPFKFARLTLVAAALAVSPVVLTTIAPSPASAQAFSALRQAIAEASAEDERLAAFYRERGFEPVWTVTEAADRRNALLAAFEAADAHALPTSRYDADTLRAAFRNATNPYMRGQADVLASRMFLQYAQDVHSGMLDPDEVVSDIVHTLPRRDPVELFTEFLDSNPRAFMASLPPQHPEYTRIMRARLELQDLAQRGGYGPRVAAGSLRPGEEGAQVVALRNRLMAMGYLERSATATYDARLQAAVVAFQMANGIEADGIAGPDTIRAVNRTVDDHLGELAVALERQRWLNFERGDRHIFVNLTDYHVHVIDDGEITFTTRSVIGAQASDRQTPEFSDVMEHMVINPSWYIPRSIARRSYIPSILAGGSRYLRLRAGGRDVAWGSVDLSRYSVSNFPFDLRQPPGPRNALGLVKFMFPNQWNIYLHDTPEDHLFSREVRTYSSGCVRLAEPFEFAYHLLAAQEEDPVGFFHRTLDSGQETYVYLDEQIPVHITYWTAWVSPDGRLNTRDDVYGRNERLENAIRALGVEIGGVSS